MQLREYCSTVGVLYDAFSQENMYLWLYSMHFIASLALLLYNFCRIAAMFYKTSNDQSPPRISALLF